MNVTVFSVASKLVLVSFTVLLLVLARYSAASRRPRGFPPGPPTLPIIGNLHQFPLKKPFIRFLEWSKQYGAVVGLNLDPQNVIVLNNYGSVKELFDKRGAIYSSRPDSYVSNELLCRNETHILLVPYGQSWRALRKAVQALLNVTAVDGPLPVQEAKASQTVYELMTSPEKCFTHIRRYSAAVILASVFGQRSASYEAPKVQALYHAQEQFTEILAPGATPPMDPFPFLRYMPTFLAPYKRWAANIRQEQRTLYSGLLNETKARTRKQDKIPCFMDKLLEGKEKSGLDDEQIVYTGEFWYGSLWLAFLTARSDFGFKMEAGSDSTSSTLHSFVLAMVKYPEVLRKAQKELDEVCGPSKSPGSQDVKNLPLHTSSHDRGERSDTTLRWRPVAPGGVPHMLIQDDIYEGYFLRKGTIVFANTWSIHQDTSEYNRPEEFIPERFLNDKFGSKGNNQSSHDDESNRRVTYSFGARRRVCSGQRLAENSLMINMSKMAWAFDIKADPSAPPLGLDVETGHSGGFVFGPNPFSASFSIRSQQHQETILREYEEAKIFFQKYED
ncbi:uncharacterized protein Z519_00422 [Cladophialophora bantiana CBS 173.52]|uniref:Cytochrome P450 oxidoreductase n=1 Tax=Cladophialophora bantiana (strain ATCC 10958 / CBS 173.52 / CDC B-1940 / NIH 8579) TaxID=1442370 RepID=A0A0D2IPM7_CLAB1|nr:uncharacterized protein Z519_00422 [Cladophialophora bantiana CBS 173.52]KIW98759.1 hypothetical protein Z519_00422 [Cladophialophora bantiana CBS 173.52]